MKIIKYLYSYFKKFILKDDCFLFNQTFSKKVKKLDSITLDKIKEIDQLILNNKSHFDVLNDFNKVALRYNKCHDHYSIFFKNSLYINSSTKENLYNSFDNADALLVHGQASSYTNSFDVNYFISHKKPIFFTEDGFLHSIVRSVDFTKEKKYRIGCSIVLDYDTSHFNIHRESLLEKKLNSEDTLLDADIQRAKYCINLIITNFLSKYNNQPIYNIDIGRKNVHKVLVVDQACNDLSISLSGASEHTFSLMLEDAIKENPKSDIFIKVHPDMIANPNRGGVQNKKYGHYTNIDISKYKNVFLISDYLNPISLLKQVDKVYVCSSQMGFEAILCDKEVIAYGAPFYVGWGVCEYRGNKAYLLRRTKTRTKEEIFYYAYIWYSRYINPETAKQIELEDFIHYLIKNRTNYFLENSIRCDDNHFLDYIYNKNIDYNVHIAFCFDLNYYKQAIVAILSLLDFNDEDFCQYTIHCVCEKNITENIIEEIKSYVLGKKSLKEIKFYFNSNNYENSYECRGISKATYTRLNLHNILQIEKVIYSDVDVLFNKSLLGLYNMDLGEYLFAACLDVKVNTKYMFNSLLRRYKYWRDSLYTTYGNYYSAGFMLMNLSKIKDSNLDKQWESLSKNTYNFQDMDIINITANNRIYPISSGYCVIPKYVGAGYLKTFNEKNIPLSFLNDTRENIYCYHFAGKKPWDDPSIPGADLWWRYIDKYYNLKSLFQNIN